MRVSNGAGDDGLTLTREIFSGQSDIKTKYPNNFSAGLHKFVPRAHGLLLQFNITNSLDPKGC